jgi:hypothetical protein
MNDNIKKCGNSIFLGNRNEECMGNKFNDDLVRIFIF